MKRFSTRWRCSAVRGVLLITPKYTLGASRIGGGGRLGAVAPFVSELDLATHRCGRLVVVQLKSARIDAALNAESGSLVVVESHAAGLYIALDAESGGLVVV